MLYMTETWKMWCTKCLIYQRISFRIQYFWPKANFVTAGYIWLTKVVTLQKLMDHLPLQWWFWCAHGLESIFPCKCGYLSPLIIDAMITACSKHATRKRKGVDSSSSSTLDGNEWGWFLAIGKTDQPHWCCICTIGKIAQKCGRNFT